MNDNQHNANQRGSALLLTLGVLSLALILSMAFAFSSRTSRTIAKVNADMIKAKLLAQSGLTRVMAAMYHDTEKTPGYYIARKTDDLPFNETIDDSVRYLSMGTDTSAKAENNLINTLVRNCDYIAKLKAKDATFAPAGFQSIFDSDNKVIGRIGFIVLEESGKIDLNQALNLNQNSNNIPLVKKDEYRIHSGTDTFTAASDFYYNILGGYNSSSRIAPSTQVDESNSFRMGLHTQEIRMDSKYLSALPSAGSTNKKAQWMSYNHLLNSTEYTTDATSFDDDILLYTFFSGEEPEAYYDKDATERERQRFDITGYEWRSSKSDSYYSGNNPDPEKSGWQHPTATSGTAGASDYARNLVHALRKDSQPFRDASDNPADVIRIEETTVPASFSGIPWLDKLTPDTCRLQVAANLVDYCDSDSWATIPDDVTWTSTEEPAYCGNEKVPYFNEVKLEVVAEKSFVAPNYTFRLRIVPSVELVNIFDEKLNSKHFQVRIIGTYQLTEMAAAIAFDKTFSFYPQDINKISYGKDTITPSTGLNTEIHTLQQATDITDAEYTLTIEKIVMVAGTSGNNDQISDFAFWQGSEQTTLTPDTTFDTQYASLEVDDPRVNHLSDRWKWRSFNNDENNHSLDEDNKDFKPNTNGFDPEDVDFSNDKTFSTAFIRDAPMESFCELGAIHRGAAWQTLNLRSFSEAGDYAGGDAMILDQVKIGPVKFSRGKYNPNAINPKACSKLLAGIKQTDAYDASTWGGDAGIPHESAWLAVSEFRGSLANVLATLGGNTDREIEAYMGRTANLLSTRNDCYTIIVLAQAMQEIPDIDENEFNKIKDGLFNPTVYTVGGTPKYCSILATQVLMAHVVRDAWFNTYQIVQQSYLENNSQ